MRTLTDPHLWAVAREAPSRPAPGASGLVPRAGAGPTSGRSLDPDSALPRGGGGGGASLR